jgi:hypothetical protein
VPGLSLAGFDKRSFFDSNGNMLPAADALGQLAVPVVVGTQSAAGNITVSWPLSGAGWRLEATTELLTLGSWTPVTNNIEITGTRLRVTLPAGSPPERLFRLRAN